MGHFQPYANFNRLYIEIGPCDLFPVFSDSKMLLISAYFMYVVKNLRTFLAFFKNQFRLYSYKEKMFCWNNILYDCISFVGN